MINWVVLIVTILCLMLDLQLPVQLVPKVESLNPIHGEVYSI